MVTDKELAKLEKRLCEIKKNLERAEFWEKKLLKKVHKKEEELAAAKKHGEEVIAKVNVQRNALHVKLEKLWDTLAAKETLHQRKAREGQEEIDKALRKLETQQQMIGDFRSDLERLQAEIGLLELESESD